MRSAFERSESELRRIRQGFVSGHDLGLAERRGSGVFGAEQISVRKSVPPYEKEGASLGTAEAVP